ncbi:polysaccharide lyase 8 family protein [Bowmanella sp. Y26]|uniref:polysaccharide lyase 8 family protein n=1 Tax=Bowmanella yangjiangensis TaxID=2811230 RepID=UPI001BDD58D8|nr:polysaccharide lyase 8 family protein [Bowmanella yangjiangensis]MBT1063371.1 polysaccharide lyase 8 family protein [Bowmanella yangjiangensis]
MRLFTQGAYRRALLITLLLSANQQALADSDLQRLETRVLGDFLPSIKAKAPEHEIFVQASKWLSEQGFDGSWADIDYRDTRRAGWPPIQHLQRLTFMTKAHALSGEQRYLDASLRALDYWFKVKPTSTNWWWASIGIPLQLGPIGLLLDGKLPDTLKQQILASLPPHSILEVPANTPKHAGANRTDIAKAVLHAGLMTDDESAIELALDAIEETIAVTEGEGIQQDFSFHQHGPLLHNGSYGKVFMHTALYWAYQVRDLKWAFATDKVNILSAYILDGDRWMTRGDTIDYSTMGRAISRPNSNFGAVSQAARYLAELDPNRRQDAQAFADYLAGGPVGLDGVRHYWRSDYSVVQRPAYQFTVHMHSTRVRPTETGNGENLKGKWLGFGNTFLRLSGDEYKGIFPVWNWARLPGVTAPDIEAPGLSWGKKYPASDFVGGLSNGNNGVAVMQLNQEGLKANKAWFMFNAEIVALGADIAYEGSEPVLTTVEQNLLHGQVTADGQVLASGRYSLNHASWVHHNQTGYLFPKGASGNLELLPKVGNWYQINNNASKTMQRHEIFELTLSHQQQNHYAYVLYPGKSAEQTSAYAQAMPITILANTADQQAIWHKTQHQLQAVFYQPGSVNLPDGVEVNVDTTCVLLLDKAANKVYLSTPGTAAQVKVTISNKGHKQSVTLSTPKDTALLGSTVATSIK